MSEESKDSDKGETKNESPPKQNTIEKFTVSCSKCSEKFTESTQEKADGLLSVHEISHKPKTKPKNETKKTDPKNDIPNIDVLPYLVFGSLVIGGLVAIAHYIKSKKKKSKSEPKKEAGKIE